MENQNNRQGKNQNENNNQDNGMMDKIGQRVSNVVDAITGEDQDNGKQKGRNNNR